MYRTLKELLPTVTGIPESVIAVNLDIRGFSRFSLSVDSASIAKYVRKIYFELIDRYFSNASFIKTTGDGLLLAIPYKEDSAQIFARESMDACLNVVQNFNKICIGDPEINFEIPQNIGIGLSRGVACRLVSGNQTLDYSGKAVSMASKLMNIARPSGIVFDNSFDIGLLSSEQQELFEKEAVYITGVAETEAIDIWYTKYFTEISPGWKKPIPTSNWQTMEEAITLKLMKVAAARRNWFSYLLPSTPAKLGMTKVQIEHPALIEGEKSETVTRIMDFSGFNYNIQGGKFFVRVNFAELVEKLSTRGILDDWEVTIRIKYQ